MISGFSPLIATTLIAGTTIGNGLVRVAMFIAATALISAIAIGVAKESRRRSLQHVTTQHGEVM